MLRESGGQIQFKLGPRAGADSDKPGTPQSYGPRHMSYK
jgi:hypothetical protein